MPEAYEKDAFNADTFLLQEVKRLIAEFGVQTAVETGTYYGGTTVALCHLVPNVVSIEINPDFLKEAQPKLQGFTNLNLVLGNSVEVLGKLLPTLTPPVLFFLDAHWNNYCPLPDEIREIGKAGVKPIIVIHDFYVPGTDLGFDTYHGQRFDFEWVKEALDSIGPYHHYYNTPDKAEGARRGVLFVNYLKG